MSGVAAAVEVGGKGETVGGGQGAAASGVALDKKKGWIEFSPLPPVDFERARKEKI